MSSRRQRACTICANSRRKCDRQLPECQRCLNRDVSCVYPQPRRRRDHPAAHRQQIEQSGASQNLTGVSIARNSFDLETWGELEPPPFSNITSSELEVLPSSPVLVASSFSPLLRYVFGEDSVPSDSTRPWFVKNETWAVGPVVKERECVLDTSTERDFRSFIRTVEEMLQSWVRNGHNGFIHRRLYENSMPTCIQDAFTSVATYMSRTAAVEDAILQIIEARSNTLASQNMPTTTDSRGILTQLAYVQSIFIFIFIRLFNGSVRARATAEQQLPLLRSWVHQMWETSKHCSGVETTLISHQTSGDGFEKQYADYLANWKLWILTESVRRTQLVVETTINVYEALSLGWTHCKGASMVTARKGLWEATCSITWFELSSKKSPLLLPSLNPGPVMSQYKADEVDDVLKLVWTIIVGSEKIQYWSNMETQPI